ncbi:MAG: hypothetical protein BIFFINMI_03226 [Phycisphaerae bacterium]|nr:hypothetical protein [Phycisphaerae bacterium]
MRLEMIHPVVVHLAIGLLAGSVVFGLLGWLLKRVSLRWTGIWTLWAGVALALLSIVTGGLAEDNILKDKPLHDLIETHCTMAWITLGVFAAAGLGWLLAWSGKRKKWEPWLHLLGVVGLALISVTGYLGGEMVYNHGAAVDRQGTPVQKIDMPKATTRPDSDFIREAD